MPVRPLLNLIGTAVAAVGVAMLAPVAIAALYQEWEDAQGIALAAAITFGAGVAAMRAFPKPGALSVRQGFAVVGLTWFAISAFGCLPYLLTGTIPGITDAYFETAAGFTTTGSTVIGDLELVGRGILMWRALTQWIGGMGVLVLSIAVLPLLGVGALHLARAESGRGTADRLTPRFKETAKRLWLVYVGLTFAQVVLLWVGDMDLFESVAHSLTTVSTGGFGVHDDSVAGFSAYTQWVLTAFMFLGGTSFALHYRALRQPGAYLDNFEFRLYVTILAAASVLVVLGTWAGAVGDTIRTAVFTVVSVVTTTGFVSEDWALWSVGLQVLIVGLMFVGGMSGSTSGSVKPYRLAVLLSASRNDIRRLVHPRGVFVTRLGRQPVPDHVVESAQSFFLLYMFIFMTGTLVMGIIESRLGLGLDLVTSASAVAGSLGNVGSGLGAVGPSSTFEVVPAAGKWLLSFLMIVGRIEIFPVLLLFTRELWRR